MFTWIIEIHTWQSSASSCYYMPGPWPIVACRLPLAEIKTQDRLMDITFEKTDRICICVA